MPLSLAIKRSKTLLTMLACKLLPTQGIAVVAHPVFLQAKQGRSVKGEDSWFTPLHLPYLILAQSPSVLPHPPLHIPLVLPILPHYTLLSFPCLVPIPFLFSPSYLFAGSFPLPHPLHPTIFPFCAISLPLSSQLLPFFLPILPPILPTLSPFSYCHTVSPHYSSRILLSFLLPPSLLFPLFHPLLPSSAPHASLPFTIAFNPSLLPTCSHHFLPYSSSHSSFSI